MENYAPVAANSPPRSFQEHDASLGSSSASPAHSHQCSLQSGQEFLDTISQTPVSLTASKDEVGDDQNLSDFPSPFQRAALTALQGYDDGTILAWLTGIRSFRLGGQNWFQPDCLSTPQLEAICTLKNCADSLITAWLEDARYDGQYPFFCLTNNHPLKLWRRRFQLACQSLW